MKQTKNWLIIGFLLCCTSALKAQVNPHPGYIITLQNDTINGTIDYRTATHNSHYCIFQAAGNSEYQTFSPTEINSYRLTDTGKYYVSRTIELGDTKKNYFLEYLIKGLVSLYYISYNEADYFFFEDELGQMYTTCITGNGEIGGTGNWRQHRSQMIRPIFEVFRESPNIQRKLTESNLDKKGLSELTREYHNEICTSAEECVKFEYDKKERMIELKLHAAVGIAYYTLNASQLQEDWGFEEMAQIAYSVGVGVDMYFPRASNKFYTQFFLSYSPINMKKKNVIYQKGSIQNPYCYHLDATLINTQLGCAYRLGNKKWTPILQAGILCNFINGIKAGTNAIIEDGSEWKDYLFSTKQISWGVYGGITFEHPIKQHALYTNFNYQYSKNAILNLQTLNCRIGYKF